jgi:energy-coupling factor transport system ATP-binding protein
MATIELNNVSYKYPLTKELALKEINCKFQSGKFYGIIGENGGGKTTLCNLIRGLIPHFYNGKLTGEVLVNGIDIRDWDMGELSAQIGYVFQNPFTQISGIKPTVFEEVAIGLENLGIPKEEIIEKVTHVCELLKIGDLIEKNPNELSGGQRQRVAFASIICMETEMFVIDEPTSQLDPEGTRDVFNIIRTLKESDKTIILVEHKIDLIAEFCEEIIVMQDGMIAFQGKTHEILSNLDILEHGAMIPQTAVFGHKMQQVGKPLSKIPITLSEAISIIEARRN